MHTSIGDPLVSRTPVFSSLMFPDMIKKNQIRNLAGSAPVAGSSAGTNRAAKNDTANQTSGGMSAINGPGNMISNNLTTMEPLLKKQISSTQVGVEDTTNILAVTRKPTPQPTPAPAGRATNVTGAAKATPTPSPEPSYAALPKATTLLTKPMARQSNKPFTNALDPDYNPRKATRSEVRNISGWDRLTTNVIGRSGIDSTYMNRTSYPSCINPWNVIKLADQYKVMSDTVNMTRPGSYLQQRLWAL
jgi:hypothetical protein